MKKIITSILTLSLLLHPLVTQAENLTGSVVINEIAWMGSVNSASDEWIELYNTMDFEIDLSGWTIIDDDTTEYLIDVGTIPANGYFLIASNENAANGVAPDMILPLSLSNSGDSLVLNDESANQIDEVNLSGGAWYAGSNTSKTTMELLYPDEWIDISGKWGNSKQVGGTPKAQNQTEPEAVPLVELKTESTEVNVDNILTVTAQITDAKELFSYGFDVNYDPEFFEYQNSTESSFLATNGQATSFHTGLENGLPGTLVIGNAIVENEDVNGINGNGDLFTVSFKALKEGETTITFSETSFLSDTEEDILADFAGIGITVSAEGANGGNVSETQLTNVDIGLGEKPYTVKIKWDPIDFIDKYKVLRENIKGEFEEIGETAETEFIDDQEIIPSVIYQYKVVPYSGEIAGQESLVEIIETRGFRGDNDQNHRVDGRDLTNLARSFGAEIDKDADYKVLNDSSYDGIIDGDDLIDIGANWASVYIP